MAGGGNFSEQDTKIGRYGQIQNNREIKKLEGKDEEKN